MFRVRPARSRTHQADRLPNPSWRLQLWFLAPMPSEAARSPDAFSLPFLVFLCCTASAENTRFACPRSRPRLRFLSLGALMASAANNAATAAGSALSQVSSGRNMSRQTRTNPSRTSKTVARSFQFYGQSSAADSPGAAASSSAAAVPHGLYPALTHFTDAITALPREFRRHNSLLKEVDAKAWALEENLHQLLLTASESRPVPYPPNPAPIVDGVVREYGVSQVSLPCRFFRTHYLNTFDPCCVVYFYWIYFCFRFLLFYLNL